jgi:subtilisin-like proprotein convertase family protein
VTYTFDDDAVSSLPAGSNVGSGTYTPTNDDTEGPDELPEPALEGPYGSTLANVVSAQPNGTWTLHVFDDAGGDVGSISAGWSLAVSTDLRSLELCALTASIDIPAGTPGATQGTAAPYPFVYFDPGAVFPNLNQYRLTVKLWALSHGSPRDLDVLLEGPQGQTVLLMSDAGGSAPGLTSTSITFDDYAAESLPQLTTPGVGVYRPTDFEPGEVFPPPAPPGPYGTSLSVFRGTDPAGDWKLWIVDDSPGGAGEGSTGLCIGVAPALDAAEVHDLRWVDETTLAWDAGPNARSYNLYRGTPAQLPALVDPSVDSCLRGTTVNQQLGGLSENPAASSFDWYLVRGANSNGEGSPGFYRRPGQILARVMDSAGTCP